jgi:hypothetical protein
VAGEARSPHQFAGANPLAGCPVKENRVLLKIPDGRDLDAARPMDAEKNPAEASGASQRTSGEREGMSFKLFVLAKCLMNEMLQSV